MTEGMKTSEFWVTTLGPIIMIVLNKLLGLGLSPVELGLGTIGTSSYGVSRGLAKNKLPTKSQ